nr:MAG TPA: hypothetical protein [Caudoviricetes sp.]
MRLSEAIEQVKKEKPHSFSMDHCTLFVNEAEAAVQEFLGVPAAERERYDWNEDGNKELIAPPPYDVMYISYLKAKIDYAMEEYESYATNQAQFEADLAEWKAWAIREGKIHTKFPTKIKNWW